LIKESLITSSSFSFNCSSIPSNLTH